MAIFCMFVASQLIRNDLKAKTESETSRGFLTVEKEKELICEGRRKTASNITIYNFFENLILVQIEC